MLGPRLDHDVGITLRYDCARRILSAGVETTNMIRVPVCGYDRVQLPATLLADIFCNPRHQLVSAFLFRLTSFWTPGAAKVDQNMPIEFLVMKSH
jgi:hypothetical protein